MKTLNLTMFVLCAFLAVPATKAGEEVDRLLSEYAKIKTVTCQIRRTKEGDLGKMRFLSRVYWTNQDKLHSEGITPVKRRTIADGKRLWQYAEGDPKGFSRPIGDLSEQMTISLKMIPGTAMDQLLRLKDLDETSLAADETATKRVGIQTPQQYVVLRFDALDRLTGLRFFKTADMKDLTARYDYSDFNEAVPGVWMPMTHTIVVYGNKSNFSETVKVDRFIANQPVAESLFIAPSFFDKEIDFVDDFAKIYPSEKGM